MKKIYFLFLATISLVSCVTAQENIDKPVKKSFDLSNRTTDHFMLQYGVDRWAGTPDSINIKGGSRHFNFYFMLDKPFKNSPKFSVAYGLGISSSNIFFDKTYVDVKALSASLPFSVSYPGTDSSYFNKFKLTTIFLEAPIELRYYSNPENTNKSFKVALGIKVGTILKAYTKGKDLKDKTGLSVYGNKFIEKQNERKYFNGTKLALSARAGYGIFGVHFTYQVTQLLKEGFGAELRPYSIGLTISGL
ncbi:MAG: outer membrane beta-barrel protein [Chitinophagaceae bacterium]|nr:outer membrane beta-barrel protein [Chitinophagaceae bacterium]MCW5904521.1 outer membrane beta-barrel protein [Chitinophagaceae bacterium]